MNSSRRGFPRCASVCVFEYPACKIHIDTDSLFCPDTENKTMPPPPVSMCYIFVMRVDTASAKVKMHRNLCEFGPCHRKTIQQEAHPTVVAWLETMTALP